MRKGQRTVLTCACLLFAVATLFPPWMSVERDGNVKHTCPLGLQFLFVTSGTLRGGVLREQMAQRELEEEAQYGGRGDAALWAKIDEMMARDEGKPLTTEEARERRQAAAFAAARLKLENEEWDQAGRVRVDMTRLALEWSIITALTGAVLLMLPLVATILGRWRQPGVPAGGV